LGLGTDKSTANLIYCNHYNGLQVKDQNEIAGQFHFFFLNVRLNRAAKIDAAGKPDLKSYINK